MNHAHGAVAKEVIKGSIISSTAHTGSKLMSNRHLSY
jgi:hypothetical protein